MALPGIGALWNLARRVEDLFALTAKVELGLAAINGRLDGIEKRVLQLEADQRQMVTEARSAAIGAASILTGSVISENATGMTRLEGRVDILEQDRKALPSPE